MLNSTQLAALKADILTHASLDAARLSGDDAALAAYYNTQSTFIVWRTKILPNEYKTAITWTEVDALTIGKARIWEWLTSAQTDIFNPSLANIRQGVSDAFTASAPTTKAALLVMAKRSATVLEQLLASGTGTSATPGLLSVEGNISIGEISGAR